MLYLPSGLGLYIGIFFKFYSTGDHFATEHEALVLVYV